MAKAPSSSKKDNALLEVTIPDGFSAFVLPIAIILSAVIVSASVIYAGSKLAQTGSTLGAADTTAQTDTTGTQDTGDTAATGPGTVIRQYETFTEYETEVCKENGKPVVYLFSTTWCPHCQWIKDTFDAWARANSDKVTVYHWELDTKDNTLTDAVETEIPADANSVYEAFNPNGSIPTFVFGCRYGRVGNGFESENDLGKETAAYDAVVNELL